MKTIQLHVTGMTCSSCVNHVQKDVEELKGVRSAFVDLNSEKVEVTFDEESLTVAAIIRQIQDAGYDASSIPEDSASRNDEATASEKVEKKGCCG